MAFIVSLLIMLGAVASLVYAIYRAASKWAVCVFGVARGRTAS